ncbi:hypothetical protein FOC1_g10006210 [Fusarium oxysporum f. sp. cubense race 1]|uniref:Uncharacterized protein n=1 Tax=Fusarium oxysporum f. sp. cubense (strain race 1) TaxID=1229664 RepID=N4UJ28_FUSC1|nr:hypothetical protein FOC1_g10006210 [Fusarium oxysporum f. sp. cubense race 1]
MLTYYLLSRGSAAIHDNESYRHSGSWRICICTSQSLCAASSIDQHELTRNRYIPNKSTRQIKISVRD